LFDSSDVTKTDVFAICIVNMNLWHCRMGHLSDERLNVLTNQNPYITIEKYFLCDSCHQAKQRKLSFTLSDTRSVKAFQLLHTDIWGPCFNTAMHGHRFFLTIIDGYSRFT